MKKPIASDFNVDFSEDCFPTEEERDDLFEYIDSLENYIGFLESKVNIKDV